MRRTQQRGNRREQQFRVCHQQLADEDNHNAARRIASSLRHSARGRQDDDAKYCMEPFFGFCRCENLRTSPRVLCKSCTLTSEWVSRCLCLSVFLARSLGLCPCLSLCLCLWLSLSLATMSVSLLVSVLSMSISVFVSVRVLGSACWDVRRSLPSSRSICVSIFVSAFHIECVYIIVTCPCE